MGAVEFSDELLGALYIVDRVPFVFFNTIALPAYQVLNLSMEYLTVEDLFNFIFFNAIANNRGRRQGVTFLTFGDQVALKGT